MALVVADTEVLLDALHGRDPAAARVTMAIETGTLATTAISALELLGSAESKRARKRVDRLLAALPILPFDEASSRAAAEARRTLGPGGAALGIADYLIAGICLAHSATLLTRDIERFSRVEGLRLDRLLEP